MIMPSTGFSHGVVHFWHMCQKIFLPISLVCQRCSVLVFFLNVIYLKWCRLTALMPPKKFWHTCVGTFWPVSVCQKFWYTETRGPLAAAVTPLSFYWLSHFPAPQPLHLVAPPPSALTSFIHFALTFCRTLLVRLVFALPGASPPPSRRDSARCRLSSHPPHLPL